MCSVRFGMKAVAALGRARSQRAADLLPGSDLRLAEIGVAGYADQPRVTREFKRRTAMTPASEAKPVLRLYDIALNHDGSAIVNRNWQCPWRRIAR